MDARFKTHTKTFKEVYSLSMWLTGKMLIEIGKAVEYVAETDNIRSVTITPIKIDGITFFSDERDQILGFEDLDIDCHLEVTEDEVFLCITDNRGYVLGMTEDIFDADIYYPNLDIYKNREKAKLEVGGE